MLDIRLATGEKVVETDDIITLLDEAVAKMGSEESGSAGYEKTHQKDLTSRESRVESRVHPIQ